MAKTESRVTGTPVLRKEDPELLTGQGKYADDLSAPGVLWMHVVRSPYAHARIGRVDLSKALAMPGVVAAFSGQDLADDWAGPLLMAWPVTEDIHNPPHWPLTKDKARHQGDGIEPLECRGIEPVFPLLAAASRQKGRHQAQDEGGPHHRSQKTVRAAPWPVLRGRSPRAWAAPDAAVASRPSRS